MKRIISFFIPLMMLILLLAVGNTYGQKFNYGQVRGSFQMDAQAYLPDSAIGITEGDLQGEKIGMNAFANIIYTNGKFTAGLRYQAFLKPLIGYDDAWEGQGIAHRYISYTSDKFEFTAGHFFDQFGNGLIFRSYEEWYLGYDNAIDGIKIKFTPIRGINLKMIYGTQRYYWKRYREEPKKRGIVKGFDAEFSLNDFIPGLKDSRTQVIIGGSAVSKYEKDDPTAIEYKMPENVAAFAGRFNISRGRFGIDGEYAYKINDPSELNNYIYKPGQALLLTARYTQKGIGVILSAKYTDNMYYKSRRTETANALDINFLPPVTTQHSYSLFAMYPYATQPLGELGLSGQIVYTIPKKSKLGGRYGISLTLDYSTITDIHKEAYRDDEAIGERGTYGYNANFFAPGDVRYFDDLSIFITKKVNKKFKFIAGYTHQNYNFDVIEEGIVDEPEHGFIIYNINAVVLDMTYKFTPKKALRLEIQYLATRQDSGNWVGAIFEYTIAPKWFIAAMDEINFNNPVSDNVYHYYNFAFGYTNRANRIAISYGRQREGILCVGGVCRNVPALSGFTITLSSSF